MAVTPVRAGDCSVGALETSAPTKITLKTMKFLTQLFSIDKSPKRGLLALEWLVMAYTVFTLLVALFTYTNLQNPDAMIWGRVRVVAMTVALWVAYRLVPCRLTLLARVMAQMSLLAWWYPDTYELNRMFPNLDHVFCRAEQSVFGFQPALTFASTFSWAPISELMSMGYAAYYPMIGLVAFYYFFARYKEFERASFVLLASFFIYYIVFIFVPVAGPTFYFKAVGLENIANGFFPAVGTYFNTHQECLPTPGYVDGFFYDLVEQAKAAGERPTAAFPSSHVGVSTVCMWLAYHSGNRRLFLFLAPFYFFLCLATVYIQAHYAIDAIAGLITGTALYFALMYATKGIKG